MRYAINKEGIKVEAEKGKEYNEMTCPCCGNAVDAIVNGEIKAPHFRHAVRDYSIHCPDKNMCEWHVDWQNKFPEDNREVYKKSSYTGKKKYYRADILTKKGVAIEFQHSRMPLSDFLDRSNFWKNIIWVLDGEKFFKNKLLRVYHEEIYHNLGFVKIEKVINTQNITTKDLYAKLRSIEMQIESESLTITRSYIETELNSLKIHYWVKVDNLNRFLTVASNLEFLVTEKEQENKEVIKCGSIQTTTLINSIEKPVFVDNLKGLEDNEILYLNPQKGQQRIFSKEQFVKHYTS